MKEKIAELIVVADKLAEELRAIRVDAGGDLVALAEQNKKFEDQSKRTSFALKCLFAGLLAALALFGMFGFAWFQIDHNNDEITKITTRLNDTQSSQKQQVLCPLYTVLVAADTAAARAATPPESQERRDQTFKVIRDGYRSLGCIPPLPPEEEINRG